MKKKIEYLHLKFIKEEYNSIKKNKFLHIEELISEKYFGLIERTVIRSISALAFTGLIAALYLQYAEPEDTPSYRMQLTMLYDFRELFLTERNPKYFHYEKKYHYNYRKMCDLVDAYQYFKDTGKVSSEFTNTILESNKENFSMDQIENILLFSKEVTLAMITMVTHTVEEQLYRFFPTEAPEFVKNILNINPSEEANILTNLAFTINTPPTSSKKVSFA